MKMLGVERIISVSAVGSLRDDLPPQDFLIPDQFFDRTRGRIATFFGGGIVAHVGFDKPTCTHLSAHIGEACARAGVKAHRGGTYVCMEGPQFSTLAESHTYRQLQFDVIGMTNLTEAKLAREAEICYATIAMITDYDCWHPQHDAVTVSEIIENLNRNTSNVQRVLHEAVAQLPEDARLQMRSSAGSRRAHRPQNDFRSHQEAPRADHRQVHFLDAAHTKFNECRRNHVITSRRFGRVRWNRDAVRQARSHVGRRRQLFRARRLPFRASAPGGNRR